MKYELVSVDEEVKKSLIEKGFVSYGDLVRQLVVLEDIPHYGLKENDRGGYIVGENVVFPKDLNFWVDEYSILKGNVTLEGYATVSVIKTDQLPYLKTEYNGFNTYINAPEERFTLCAGSSVSSSILDNISGSLDHTNLSLCEFHDAVLVCDTCHLRQCQGAFIALFLENNRLEDEVFDGRVEE